MTKEKDEKTDERKMSKEKDEKQTSKGQVIAFAGEIIVVEGQGGGV
ncbi:MAG: hypothetical protein ACOX62_03400 [Christensenellales bacterium]